MAEAILHCVICGTEGSLDEAHGRELGLTSEFGVRSCAGCALSWLSPRPTASEYEELYRTAYFDRALGTGERKEWRGYLIPDFNYTQETIRERERIAAARLARLESLRGGPGSLLDVGAARGEFLVIARQRGWRVIGIEPSAVACAEAHDRHGLDLFAGTLEQFPSNEPFDVVHLSHVLEHVNNPLDTLRRIHTMLQPRGFVCIEVPNQFYSLVDRLLRMVGRAKSAAPTLESIHHTYFYSTRSLAELSRQAEFSLVSLSTHLPEMWEGSMRKKLLGAVNRIADLGGRGRVIELLSKKLDW